MDARKPGGRTPPPADELGRLQLGYDYASAQQRILHVDSVHHPVLGHLPRAVVVYAGTGSYRLRLDLTRGVRPGKRVQLPVGTPTSSPSPRRNDAARGGGRPRSRPPRDRDYFGRGPTNAGNAVELTATVLSPSTLSDVKVTLVDAAGAAIPDSDGNAADAH